MRILISKLIHHRKYEKVALVTTGGQGIGEAICKRLSKDGFAVSVADINRETSEKVAEEIKQNGGRAIAIKMNVADRKSVFAAVDKTAEKLGGFDVMVNNAAIAPTTPIDTISTEQFDQVFKINVGSVVWGIQAASIKLKELGIGGRIINANSQAGLGIQVWPFIAEANLP